jgi:hypothetical protein
VADAYGEWYDVSEEEVREILAALGAERDGRFSEVLERTGARRKNRLKNLAD